MKKYIHISVIICVYLNIIMYLQGMKIMIVLVSFKQLFFQLLRGSVLIPPWFPKPVRLGLNSKSTCAYVAQHTGVEYTIYFLWAKIA